MFQFWYGAAFMFALAGAGFSFYGAVTTQDHLILAISILVVNLAWAAYFFTLGWLGSHE